VETERLALNIVIGAGTSQNIDESWEISWAVFALDYACALVVKECARSSPVATSDQVQREQTVRGDRAQAASVNHGPPAVTETPKPGAFTARPAATANQSAMNRPAPSPPANSANPPKAMVRPLQNDNQQVRIPE